MASPPTSRRNTPGNGPLAYLLTFTCYGTWLHGDERGSVAPGMTGYDTPRLAPSSALLARDTEARKHGPFALDAQGRAIVSSAIREVCAFRLWPLHALNVRTNHVHAVVAADATPERVLVDLKARATHRLREAGLIEARPAWTRHGSTRYVWTEEDLERACQYVVEGQGPDLAEARP